MIENVFYLGVDPRWGQGVQWALVNFSKKYIIYIKGKRLDKPLTI